MEKRGTKKGGEAYELIREKELEAIHGYTTSLRHTASGMQIYCMDNEDVNLGFALVVRVPQENEADLSHALEHSLLAGSKKYPGTDMFFDLDSQSFHSYLNAQTMGDAIYFPVCSLSQEQLEIAADALMSCFTDPLVLDDPRIFQREALRLRLERKNAPLELEGTVYTEDLGMETELSDNTIMQVLHHLYPDDRRGNMSGRCYADLEHMTYENMIDLYRRYCRMDNALILLYGKMDYDRMLAFLDREYLSRSPRRPDSDAEEYSFLEGFEAERRGWKKSAPSTQGQMSEPQPSTFIPSPLPVHLEDDIQGQSSLVMAWDLSELTEEERRMCPYFAALMSMQSGPLDLALRKNGMTQAFSWHDYSYVGYEAGFEQVSLYGVSEELAERFENAVIKTLSGIAADGFAPELIKAAYRDECFSIASVMADSEPFLNLEMEAIGSRWAETGRTDALEHEEEELSMLTDPDQVRLKSIAGKLLEQARQVKLYLYPERGLAEREEEKRAAWLKTRKKEMSPEQIRELIHSTREYDEWSEERIPSGGFMIDPSLLPEPVKETEVREEDIPAGEDGNIHVLTADTGLPGIVRSIVFFDTSRIPEESLHELLMLTDLFAELNLKNRTKEELDERLSKLVPEYHVTVYHGGRNTPYDYPMLQISISTTSEDQAEAFALMLETIREASYTPVGVKAALEKFKDTYNPAQFDSVARADLAVNAHLSHMDRYQQKVLEGYFKFLMKVSVMNENELSALTGRLHCLAEEIISSRRVVLVLAADDRERDALLEAELKVLKELPHGSLPEVRQEYHYDIEGTRMGICLNASSLHSLMIAPAGADIFKGEYIPFLAALSDRVIMPQLRFQNGAYSADLAYSAGHGGQIIFETYDDPDALQTLQIYENAAEELRELELTEEELQGYILSSYGNLNTPISSFQLAVLACMRKLTGYDTAAMNRVISDVRKAKLAYLEDAADALELVMKGAVYAVTGKSASVKLASDILDRVIEAG